LDAKARNIEYKDPLEEEWLRFQKELKVETEQSTNVEQSEREESTANRQIEEVDEQIHNWQKVLNLELQKEKIKVSIGKTKPDLESNDIESDNDSVDDVEIESVFDWRTKHAV